MSGALVPWFPQQVFDDNGDPLAGGKVATFAGGTDVPASVFTDANLTTPHTNPIILDAYGRPPAPIYIPPGGLKFVVSDQNDVVLYTVDGVSDAGLTGLAEFGPDLATGALNQSSGYAVEAADNLVTMASTGGTNPCVVQLMAASTRTRLLCIKNVGTVPVAVTPYLADTIDLISGALTLPAGTASLCPSVWLLSDGVGNWWIVASHGVA
jgi:hypothetical protein